MEVLEKREFLREKVFEALGAASLCWNPRPTGVFDSSTAKAEGDELWGYIEEYLDYLDDTIVDLLGG